MNAVMIVIAASLVAFEEPTHIREDEMKLGLVTYEMAAQWDVDTIIANCREAGFEGVELRATHAHGVETSLSTAERREVRQKFEGSGVCAYGLGTAFEFHSPDPAEVRRNIEDTKASLQFAAELGMEGVKVRPNGIPADVPEEQTIEQIGTSMREIAQTGADLGVYVWLEVHGVESCRVDRMRKMIDIADHANALLTFNCNEGETDDSGSCRGAYEMLKHKIGCVHIHELWLADSYPYQELLQYLKDDGYSGWVSYEGPGSSDAVLVMKCYRRLWDLMLAGD